MIGRQVYIPRDRTQKSWKYFNFLLSGQQRRRINRNQKFLLMAHAQILFCPSQIRCLFSGVELALRFKLYVSYGFKNYATVFNKFSVIIWRISFKYPVKHWRSFTCVLLKQNLFDKSCFIANHPLRILGYFSSHDARLSIHDTRPTWVARKAHTEVEFQLDFLSKIWNYT